MRGDCQNPLRCNLETIKVHAVYRSMSMVRHFGRGCLLLGSFLTMASCSSVQPPGMVKHATALPAKPDPGPCPMDRELAILVARSDVILTGVLQVPVDLLRERARMERPDYIDIPVAKIGVLKGEASQNIVVSYYPKDTDDSPQVATVIARSDLPSLIFLGYGDGLKRALYFAGYTPASLRTASHSDVGAVGAEIARQDAILKNWRPDYTAPHLDEVRALISKLDQVYGEEQQQVFEQLMALGNDAVPAIIQLMDDWRVLGTPRMQVPNPPGHWEGTAHYSPKLVVDALGIVLSRMTPGSFGPNPNGGSDAGRRAAVAAWRVYASDITCRKAS